MLVFGVVLDLKTKEGVKTLKKLLLDADVFLTNVRLGALQRLGLDWKSLQTEMPHLVYLHLSAWGVKGPNSNSPGFDIGAFWASTGMTGAFQDPGKYSSYPMAFGDRIASMNLVSAVSLGLSHRQLNGKGLCLESSLFKNGVWCLAPTILSEPKSDPPGENSIPNYSNRPHQHPLSQSYITEDGVHIQLFGLGHEQDLLSKLKKIFSGLPSNYDHKDKVHQQKIRQILSDEIKTHSRKRIEEIFKGGDIPYLEIDMSSTLFTKPPNQTHLDADLFTKIPTVTDIPRIIKLPVNFHGSKTIGPIRPAPQKGEHTNSIIAKGWSKRDTLVPQSHQPAKCLQQIILLIH